MTITNSNTTGNLIESIWDTLKSILGSSYINANLGNKTITYKIGFPRLNEGYKDELPIVFLNYRRRLTPVQYEQGGRRTYGHLLNIHVIAGGYNNELQNELMKQDLLDKIIYGFDNKDFNYIISDTQTVEGRYSTLANEVARIITDDSDSFERHHGVIEINANIKVLNN